MNELASSMESTYSTAKICKYGEDLSDCEPSMSLGGKSLIVYYQNESIEWILLFDDIKENVLKCAFIMFFRFVQLYGKKPFAWSIETCLGGMEKSKRK